MLPRRRLLLGSGVIDAPSVAAIVAGEKERVRRSTGYRLTWRTTVLHGTLVTKVEVSMMKKGAVVGAFDVIDTLASLRNWR